MVRLFLEWGCVKYLWVFSTLSALSSGQSTCNWEQGHFQHLKQLKPHILHCSSDYCVHSGCHAYPATDQLSPDVASDLLDIYLKQMKHIVVFVFVITNFCHLVVVALRWDHWNSALNRCENLWNFWDLSCCRWGKFANRSNFGVQIVGWHLKQTVDCFVAHL